MKGARGALPCASGGAYSRTPLTLTLTLTRTGNRTRTRTRTLAPALARTLVRARTLTLTLTLYTAGMPRGEGVSTQQSAPALRRARRCGACLRWSLRRHRRRPA